MVAQVCNLKVGDFVHTLGDAHLYNNHIEQAREQLTRKSNVLPILHIDPAIKDIFAFRYEHFQVENYHPHPSIKAPIAV